MRHLLCALALLLPAAARAGDTVDTRVTFTLADDDILKGPESSATGSPTIPNFTPNSRNRLFYDDYERRDTGFENLTHFVIYAHQPGFFEGLDTEAGLVLRAEILSAAGKKLSGDGVALNDDGSYIKLTKDFGDEKRLSLTGFPISADRLALGYSYDISWGGRGIFKGGPAPGLKLQYDAPTAYSFLAVKTGLAQVIESDNTLEEDTVWGVMGGGGVDIADELRLEAGAGYFHRGTIDKAELRVIKDGVTKVAPWDAFGGSGQVAYHVGIPVGVPIDFRLYKNDPLKRQEFFKPENYDGLVSFVVQSEVNAVGQTLQDPEHPSSTKVQPAIAADASARVKVGYWRFFVLAVYRDLAYLLFNTPSLPPFSDFPAGIKVAPEYFFFVGVDHFFESAHLTPGASFGIQRPAYQRAALSIPNAPQSLGQQTLIFRSADDIEVLNPGDPVALIFAGKVTARWDLSEVVGAVGELQLQYDRNRRFYAQDPLTGIASRLREDPMVFGFTLMLQARF